MISIYRSEVVDNLAEKIQKDTTLAYCVKAIKPSNPDQIIKSFAKKSDQPDLYPIETIMVSTGWNQNADVFNPLELYTARHTTEDKPLNMEHVAKDIVGHITDSWIIDTKGAIIPNDLPAEDVPSDFHIATAAVIYRQNKEPELAERIEKIIAEIEEGLWFVSMECLFRGFDYALSNEKENKIIARNEQTAFLTKYLRAYGGVGTYKDHKIGRLIRNIVFCGKGIVREPANPNSVFLKDIKSFSGATIANISEIKENSVYSNSKCNIVQENKMAESESKMVDELKATLAQLTKDNETLKKSLSDIEAKKMDEKIAALEATIKAKDEEVKSLSAQLTETKSKVTDLETKVKTSGEEATKAKADLDTFHKNQRTAVRKAKLQAKKVPEDKLDKLVSKFDMLSEEDFEEVINTFAAPSEAKESKKTEKESVSGALDDVTEGKEAALATATSAEDAKDVINDIIACFATEDKSKKVEA